MHSDRPKLYTILAFLSAIIGLYQWEGEYDSSDCRKDFMINFHESRWPDRVSNSVCLTPQSEALLTAICGLAKLSYIDMAVLQMRRGNKDNLGIIFHIC